MDREQKEKVVEELGQIFESSGVVVVAKYTGLTVAEMQELRARASEAEVSVRVAKNRLAKIALNGKSCESMSEYLSGMTVLTYSVDPVAAAKVRVVLTTSATTTLAGCWQPAVFCRRRVVCLSEPHGTTLQLRFARARLPIELGRS